MNSTVLSYIKEHKTGYINDLKKNIGEEEIRKLELVGFVKRGQDLIQKNNQWERVESYKTTEEFEDYLSIIFPKKENRGFFQKLLDKNTARLIAKNLKRAF
jgi:hypothetical protein